MKKSSNELNNTLMSDFFRLQSFFRPILFVFSFYHYGKPTAFIVGRYFLFF